MIRIAETPDIVGGEALLIAIRPPGMGLAFNVAVVKILAGVSFWGALPLRQRAIQRTRVPRGLSIAAE
jgi:hypothetical protein